MSGTNEVITNAYTWVLFALQSVSAYYFAMSDQKPRIHNFYLGASITTAYLMLNRVISNVLNAHTNHVVYFVTTLLVDIILLALMNDIDRRHEKEEQYRILEGLSQEEYDYYQKKQKDLEALRTKRHEYVNRLTLLSVKLEEQQRVAEEEGKEI